MDSRDNKKKKYNFCEKKKCAINSLREVNCFLFNFNKACIIKKILKNNK